MIAEASAAGAGAGEHSLDDGAMDLVRETIRDAPGYVGGLHLVDPATRKTVLVTVFEDGAALRRVGAAVSEQPDGGKVDIDADRVEYFEASAF